MEKKAKWSSPQSLIISVIIILIIAYIGLDAFKTKPYIKEEVTNVQIQYKELSRYLDKKIPEIDSTLKDQGGKILEQTTDIEELKSSISKLKK